MSAAPRRDRSRVRQVLSTAMIALAACTCAPGATQGQAMGSGASADAREVRDVEGSKIATRSPVSSELAAAIAEGPDGALAAAGAARFDDAGRIQAYVHCAPGSDLDAVQTALEALGAAVELGDTELHVVQAWLPTARLDEIGALPAVTQIGLPRYGRVR